MAKSLIIVESPTKTKTFKNILGSDYQVEASVGHVRDLPQRQLGVAVEDGFRPKYEPIASKRDVIKRLAALAGKSERVYLATDPDREGEAIAWHLAEVLNLDNPYRIRPNELTPAAVRHAVENPGHIDMRRVDAQEARRVLDRLVGYRLSPLLWKKVRKNLSAGRVQSVAVRLICDREREIQAFVPREYWSLTARLTPVAPAEPSPFDARYMGVAAEIDSRRGRNAVKASDAQGPEREAERLALPNGEAAETVVRALDGASWAVRSVRQQERKRGPSPPFTTSTLQQEAARKLGFGGKRTMSLAQQLYEGIDLAGSGSVGMITYMRSDSTRVAEEAQAEAREFIARAYGQPYLPPEAPVYRPKGGAQDAHEAIRPTSVLRTPEEVRQALSPDQLKLYRLIWQRFVASQMPPSIYLVTSADIDAAAYRFRATGSVVRFDGFMRVYMEGRDTEEVPDEERAALPPLEEGQPLDLLELTPRQHFTEPPPRYTEATLVKLLDEKRVGRPSTYNQIVATIQDREYVRLEERRFYPTDLGMTVNDLLVKHFPNILDVGFTADIEKQLDDIAGGSAGKVRLLETFYGPFEEALAEAHERMERVKPVQEPTDHPCPVCGNQMMRRRSRMGEFLGCSGYPRCKTMLNVDGSPIVPEERPKPEITDQPCPKCGKPLVERMGRFGKFLGCSGYPKCRTIVRVPGDEGAAPPTAVVLDQPCPKCSQPLEAKRSRFGTLTRCQAGDACGFKTWLHLAGRACPECSWPLGESVYRGRPSGVVKCSNPDCAYSQKLAG